MALVALLVGLAFWGLAALRHALLQSNAFDLGIYDQVAWLLSRGLEPRSTLLGLHHLGNHGAWAFLPVGILYRLLPSVQWLLLLQALALACTALPLWRLARARGLGPPLAWLVCGAWWLQPVVFNVNLFDFHPETLAMPLLAWACHLQTQRRWALWLAVLLLVLGFRDGLCLVVLGLGLAAALQRQWRPALAAAGLALGWLALLSRWLYPWLNGGEGPAALGRFEALGDSLAEVIVTLLLRPGRVGAVLDPAGVAFYLLILVLPLAWSWRRRSLPWLAAGLPLLIVNVLADTAAQRDLVHHYSLPLAVLMVVASVEGLASAERLRARLRRHPWLPWLWLALAWALLAKPGHFGNRYLSRLDLIAPSRQLLAGLPARARVVAPTYLAPHLTHRPVVQMPRRDLTPERLAELDVVVLNEEEPGWASSRRWMRQARERVLAAGWRCRPYGGGLQACRRP